MIGNRLFHNALAGRFICRLAWLCPLMYVSSLLSSILHGLVPPEAGTFCQSARLFDPHRNDLVCPRPGYGIGGLLYGRLSPSQVFASVACMWLLREYM